MILKASDHLAVLQQVGLIYLTHSSCVTVSSNSLAQQSECENGTTCVTVESGSVTLQVKHSCESQEMFRIALKDSNVSSWYFFDQFSIASHLKIDRYIQKQGQSIFSSLIESPRVFSKVVSVSDKIEPPIDIALSLTIEVSSTIKVVQAAS